MTNRTTRTLVPIVGLCLMSIFLSACLASPFANSFRTTFNFRADSIGSANPEWDERSYGAALWGLVDASGPIPLGELCSLGVSYVEQHVTPFNRFVAGATLGIYSPFTVSVFCSEGTAYLVQMNEAGMVERHSKLERQDESSGT